jgi:hypothetical protein
MLSVLQELQSGASLSALRPKAGLPHTPGLHMSCIHSNQASNFQTVVRLCRRNSQVEVKLRPLMRNKELHDTYLRQGELKVRGQSKREGQTV